MIKQLNGLNIILFERKDEYDYSEFIQKHINEYLLGDKTSSNFLKCDITSSEPKNIIRFTMNSLQGNNINKLLVLHCDELKLLECKMGTSKEYKGKIPTFFDELCKYIKIYKNVKTLLSCTNINKTSKIYKKIQTDGKVILCERFTLRTYISFVKQQNKKYSLNMEYDTLKYFLSIVDNNKAIIDNELYKLSLLGANKITRSIISKNVIHSKKFIVFELINAIGRGKANRSFSYIEDLLNQGSNCLQIISLLQRNFRILLYILCRTDLSEFNVNKYSKRNYDEQLRAMNVSKITNTLEILLMYEKMAKRLQISEANLLYMLIYEIL